VAASIPFSSALLRRDTYANLCVTTLVGTLHIIVVAVAVIATQEH
jgi:hypothetical protein